MSCAHTGLPRWLSGKESAHQCKRRKRPLGQKDPLEEEMATPSSILAWRIPWTEEPGGYSPWGHKESDTTERAHARVLVEPLHFLSSLYVARKDESCTRVRTPFPAINRAPPFLPFLDSGARRTAPSFCPLSLF